MPGAKPWLKMWVSWIDDPKMDRLSLEEQGAWWRLVSLSHKCAAAGALVSGGAPLTIDDMLKTLKVVAAREQGAFRQMVDKMTQWGSIHHNGESFVITHYTEEQEMVPSNSNEAVAARQRRHRAQKKPASEKREPEKSPSPPENKNKNIEERGERRRRDVPPYVTGDTSRKSRDSLIIKEITGLIVEMKKETLTEVLADQIRNFPEDYTGPVDWIRKAFLKAPLNKRRWAYVQKILERWQKEGGPDGEAGRELEGARVGADQEHAEPPDAADPLAATRRAGWKVKRSGPGEAGGGEDKE